jgi:hypothetical protein
MDQMKGDTTEEMLYVHKANRDKYFECYVRNNELIQLLNDRGMF